MSEHINYPKAAITEALIHIRVNPAEEISWEEDSILDLFREKLGSDYPEVDRIVDITSSLDFGSTIAVKGEQNFNGYLFRSMDEKYIFQAQPGGFTLSRLTPYESWELFVSEVQKIWQIYIAVVRAKQIKRIAVRYINRFDLPKPFKDFNEYLSIYPELPSQIDTGLSSYFMQLQLPQKEIGGMLIINEAVVPPPSDEFTSVLLDLDLSCDVDILIESDRLWVKLQEMRLIKNKVFESCITDKMRTLLKS
jgi:uncharacterized protein (TIGR04255 family)